MSSCGPSSSLYDLSGNFIEDTYTRLAQVISSSDRPAGVTPSGSGVYDLYDGLGNLIIQLRPDGSVVTKTTRVNQPTYTVLTTDYRIGVPYSVTGICNIQLPLAVTAASQSYLFKDEGGNALQNPIHILASGSDTIDGSTTASLNGNYHAFSIYNNGGTEWFIE